MNRIAIFIIAYLLIVPLVLLSGCTTTLTPSPSASYNPATTATITPVPSPSDNSTFSGNNSVTPMPSGNANPTTTVTSANPVEGTWTGYILSNPGSTPVITYNKDGTYTTTINGQPALAGTWEQTSPGNYVLTPSSNTQKRYNTLTGADSYKSGYSFDNQPDSFTRIPSAKTAIVGTWKGQISNNAGSIPVVTYNNDGTYTTTLNGEPYLAGAWEQTSPGNYVLTPSNQSVQKRYNTLTNTGTYKSGYSFDNQPDLFTIVT